MISQQHRSPLLALDAGGTSTRAVLLDTHGRALGYGRAGGGNPTARGIDGAVSAIRDAAVRAMAQAGVAAGNPMVLGSAATIAMAGEQTDAFADRVTDGLGRLGWPRVVLQHDLLGVFGSGTSALDGYALIAGTGSVAARVVGGQLIEVVGGRGWLLGDGGSGFWIGHRVARAVVATLDGQADETALTPLVLAASGIAVPDPTVDRARALRQLISALYAQPPVQLAALAPLAFEVPEDPTALAILVAASQALADLVVAVEVPEIAGPLVVGGSVAVRGLLAAPPALRSALVPIGGHATLIPVSDGVVGAAVLALRDAGVEVDAAVFRQLSADIEAVRTQGS